jgi:hypothetical protein
MNHLRQEVSELMVLVHLIPRELAEEHVSRMDDVEVRDRFQRYTGMELSVARRNQQSGSDFYPVFGSATATARSATLNPVPEPPTEQKSGNQSARAGSKKPGSMVARALSASY